MADWSAAAVAAAALLDELEQEYVERGSDVQIGVVAVVVELSGDIGADDEWTGVFYRCSDSRRWLQHGLFAAAQRASLIVEGDD